MSLSRKMFFIIITFGLLATFLSGFSIFYFTEKNWASILGEQQLNLARRAMERLDYYIYQKKNDINNIVLNKDFASFLQDGKSKNDIQNLLEDYSTHSGPWYFLDILGSDGIVAASSDPRRVGSNSKTDKDIFISWQKGMAGLDYNSDAVVVDSIKKRTMLISSPIKVGGATGLVTGVMVGAMNWSALEETLYINKSFLVRLYNSSGEIIAHKDFGQQASVQTDIFIQKEIAGNLFGQSGFDAGYIKEQGFWLNRLLLAATPQIGHLGYFGNDWVLVVATSIFSVSPSLPGRIFEIIFFPAISILLCAFFILLIFRKIVLVPINKITETARLMIGGEVDKMIEVKSKDEVGQLGQMFNDMTAGLKQTRLGLEKTVLERTEKLNEKIGELSGAQKALTNLAEDLEEENIKFVKIAEKDDAMLASIGDGIVAVDSNGQLLSINKSAEEMLGWNSKEMVGKSFFELIPMLDSNLKNVPIEARPLMMVMNTKRKYVSTVVSPYYFVRKDKTQFPLALTATPLIYNDAVIGAINIFRDITKELVVDRAKNEFVSVASHQLRTPLTGIKWFAELLGKTKLSKIQTDYLSQMEKSSQRMIDLVNDLLNVSRIDLGRNFDLNFAKKDITAIISDVIKEEQISAAKSKISLKLTSNFPNQLFLSIDSDKIRQVFHNLINNAVKYSLPKGEVAIDVKLKKNEATFSIQDTGLGIPEKQQDRVFSKFFRGENIVTYQTEGTGLGLYIVKAIVEAHGGKIWFISQEKVDSRTNKHGTTFYFSIPNKS